MVLSIFITLIIAAFFSIITIFLLTQLPDPINFMNLQGLSIIFLGFLLACIATAIANYKLFLTKHGHIEPKRKGLKAEGVVKWFNINKGFGFITQENGEDIFVHYRSIQGHGRKKLMEGQRVSYRVVDSDRGLQADDVEVLD